MADFPAQAALQKKCAFGGKLRGKLGSEVKNVTWLVKYFAVFEFAKSMDESLIFDFPVRSQAVVGCHTIEACRFFLPTIVAGGF